MKTYILILFSLAIIIAGCKQEKENNLPQVDSKPVIRVDDQEILDYFYSYKNNSWWVYEDEATGERDSAVMKSRDQGSTVSQKLSDKNTERISYILEWQKLPIMYVYLESSLTPNVYSISYQYKSGDIIKENGTYRTKDTINHSVKLIDTVVFNGFTFYDVLEIRINGEILHYAKNIGIIKRRPSGSLKVFSLKKYHIN